MKRSLFTYFETQTRNPFKIKFQLPSVSPNSTLSNTILGIIFFPFKKHQI